MRSVDSESESHAIERRKTQSWEPLPFDDQGPRCCTVWSGASSPAGVGLEHGRRIIEVPQELGRVLLFLLLGNSRLEIPGHQLQALPVHSSGRERKQRVHPRYRQAKETKCGEMAVGCRSTRIVLMKPGNWSRRTRWREGKTERGCLMLDPGSGNTSEASNLELRINGTAQDSMPGMQRCCMANPALEEPYALM